MSDILRWCHSIKSSICHFPFPHHETFLPSLNYESCTIWYWCNNNTTILLIPESIILIWARDISWNLIPCILCNYTYPTQVCQTKCCISLRPLPYIQVWRRLIWMAPGQRCSVSDFILIDRGKDNTLLAGSRQTGKLEGEYRMRGFVLHTICQ